MKAKEIVARAMVLTVCFTAVAICGVRAAEPQPLTPEQRNADEIEYLKMTGGDIYKPDSQKGEICYVNCQAAASAEWLKFSVDYFAEQTRFRITVRDGKFDLIRPEIQGSRSLFVVDDAALPSLLVAPENGWAMVNVAPLKSEKPAFFEARVKKELTRGFAYLCGGVGSQFPKSIVGGITGVEMLDHQPDHMLPVDVISRFPRAMKNFGITPARYTAYVNACRQGWAPAPTNEYQKAIWDKVHELPKNPMQIKFDPRKGQ